MKKAYENKQIYEFKNLLEDNYSTKILVFYHGDDQLSLFETILQSRDDESIPFISLIWVVCELWKDDKILNQVCAQKRTNFS